MSPKIRIATLFFVLAVCACRSIAAENGPQWPARNTLAHSPHSQPAIDWSREILYFLLIDRFENGDPSNDHGHTAASHVPFQPEKNNDAALKTYQGGDLQGVIDRLDYLQNLGITTLWLSPVFDNSDSSFSGWWPYHGYSPIDFFHVDEHFGTMALLQKLVREAHRRRMKVILDMIYNHVAPDHPWVRDPQLWDQAGYRHWFHPHSGRDASTSIQDWQDQYQLENYELNGLPDLAQENPHVYEFLLDVSKFWIVQTGCDGFRLDAVKHIAKPFWRKLCHDLHEFAGPHFLLLGEVFSGDSQYIAEYQALGFNALFDIPMYYAIHRVFAQNGIPSLLSDQIAGNKTYFPACLLSPLIDNHDVARFSYWAQENPKAKIQTALSFLLSMPGLPMIYYGSEIALPGAAPQNEQTGEGQDYLNRRMMDWLAVSGRDRDLHEHVRRWIRARKNHACLSDSLLIELYQDYGVYAYLRYDENEAMVVVINTAGSAEERRIGLPANLFAGGCLKDVLTGKKWRVRNDSLTLYLPAHSSLLLRYQGQWDIRRVAALAWRCRFTPQITHDRQWVILTYTNDDSVTSVAVAGDFNGWSKEIDKMTFAAHLKKWYLRLPLSKGRYRYKLVVDGQRWLADPLAREQELDPYGGSNSVLVVE